MSAYNMYMLNTNVQEQCDKFHLFKKPRRYFYEQSNQMSGQFLVFQMARNLHEQRFNFIIKLLIIIDIQGEKYMVCELIFFLLTTFIKQRKCAFFAAFHLC
jgi:hypothetical protein